MSARPLISRAAIVRAFRAPIAIEDVPVPHEVEPGAILFDLWHRCAPLVVQKVGLTVIRSRCPDVISAQGLACSKSPS
jgi:hypothetical protein